jgi:hypothetical protein
VAESIHTTYNPASISLDPHMGAVLPEHHLDEDEDIEFVKQAVFGVERYAELINSFLRAFYAHCSGNALRSDRARYALLTYLAVMRMEDLGLHQFSAIIRANDAQKMLVWTEFLFDKRHLKTCLRAEWLQIFDKAFVDGRIGALNIPHNEHHLPSEQHLLQSHPAIMIRAELAPPGSL